MTSNRVHDAARYGTHHINIADNSLDNRLYTSSPFSYNTSKTSHAHLEVFLSCLKQFGVNYITLKCFNITITESEKNSYTIALVFFNLSLSAHRDQKSYTHQTGVCSMQNPACPVEA